MAKTWQRLRKQSQKYHVKAHEAEASSRYRVKQIIQVKVQLEEKRKFFRRKIL